MEDKASINLNEPRLLITVEEAAKLLNVGMNRAYILVRTPGFPALRIGHKYFVNKMGLQKWIDKQTNID